MSYFFVLLTSVLALGVGGRVGGGWLWGVAGIFVGRWGCLGDEGLGSVQGLDFEGLGF